MAFAEGTTVPVEKTRMEIENLVIHKHGASMFTSGVVRDKEVGITFAMQGRLVRFVLPLPSAADPELLKKAGKVSEYHTVDKARLARVVGDEERRRWRCLLLAIKAKLEIVASGIATFEEEFLANVVTEGGKMTVYERIKLDTSGVRLLAPMETR